MVGQTQPVLFLSIERKKQYNDGQVYENLQILQETK